MATKRKEHMRKANNKKINTFHLQLLKYIIGNIVFVNISYKDFFKLNRIYFMFDFKLIFKRSSLI
jgi:hypothetical protein